MLTDQRSDHWDQGVGRLGNELIGHGSDCRQHLARFNLDWLEFRSSSGLSKLLLRNCQAQLPIQNPDIGRNGFVPSAHRAAETQCGL